MADFKPGDRVTFTTKVQRLDPKSRLSASGPTVVSEVEKTSKGVVMQHDTDNDVIVIRAGVARVVVPVADVKHDVVAAPRPVHAAPNRTPEVRDRSMFRTSQAAARFEAERAKIEEQLVKDRAESDRKKEKNDEPAENEIT